MNVRTALISSALLLAVLGWACEQQGPTSPSALSTPGGATGGVSLDAAGAILGVKPGACPGDHPSCPDEVGPGPTYNIDLDGDIFFLFALKRLGLLRTLTYLLWTGFPSYCGQGFHEPRFLQ